MSADTPVERVWRTFSTARAADRSRETAGDNGSAVVFDPTSLVSLAQDLITHLARFAHEFSSLHTAYNTLRFENEALRNDNLAKGKELEEGETQIAALEAKLEQVGVIGGEPQAEVRARQEARNQGDIQLFKDLLSQTPRDWYLELDSTSMEHGDVPMRDVVVMHERRKAVVVLGWKEAITYHVFGKQSASRQEWDAAGFSRTPEDIVIDKAELLSLCGLSGVPGV